MKLLQYFTLSLGAVALLSVSCKQKPETTNTGPATAPSARPWAQDSSDIEPDAKVTYGQLPNGMRYVLMPNQDPPGRVSMRLHVAAGSLMEREDQRGLAHFLEHMVFNGSKTFPDASKMIPEMQRLGISFGGGANAYTSFDETVYMLDLPNDEKETLDLAFNVMRDFSDGALLREAEIEKERGVILAEKTARDSVQMRLMEKQFVALLPDALLSKRFPIGTEEVIKNAPRSAFTDFYSQYYAPSRTTFVYVGDFDPKEAEQRIIDTFKSMSNPENVGKDPELGSLPKGQGFKTLVMSDPEVAATDLSLMVIKPFEKKADTKANRGKQLPLGLANAILGRRFSILAKKENSPITGGDAYNQNLFKFMKLGGVSVNAKDHNWKAALPVLEQELRRAIEHGFTQSELDEVKANLINQYERAVKAAPSRKTPALASALATQIHSDTVFSTPETNLAVLKEGLSHITPKTCHLALKEFWDTQDITLTLTTNTPQEQADQLLTELYNNSREVAVRAPEKKETGSFAYTDFGKPGTIAEQKHIEDLDFTQIRFQNGVACNIKKTDFSKNSVALSTRVGGGLLTMPTDKPGLGQFASAVVSAGGLGKHNVDDLQRILAGRNAGISFQVGEDAFNLSGSTTPDDLELQLQLLCGYLTDPGLRPEAERMFKAQLPAIYSQMKHTPAGAQAKMGALLRGNDSRFTFPTIDQANTLTTEDVRQWVVPALAKDYLELSIVGDIDIDKVIPILARTIGALPPRASSKPTYSEERQIANLPAPPLEKRFTFESRIPTGTSIVVWKASDLTKDTIDTTRRLGILSSILSDRMREKIREELGEAYSPFAGFQPSDTFTGVGYMLAASPGKPEQAERVGKMIIEIGNKLAAEGATQDELTRALEPRLGELAKTLRQNSYWLGTVMSKSQEQPYRLDWARQRDSDYKTITLEEINALAKQYLGKDNTFRFEIIPEQKKEE